MKFVETTVPRVLKFSAFLKLQTCFRMPLNYFFLPLNFQVLRRGKSLDCSNTFLPLSWDQKICFPSDPFLHIRLSFLSPSLIPLPLLLNVAPAGQVCALSGESIFLRSVCPEFAATPEAVNGGSLLFETYCTCPPFGLFVFFFLSGISDPCTQRGIPTLFHPPFGLLLSPCFFPLFGPCPCYVLSRPIRGLLYVGLKRLQIAHQFGCCSRVPPLFTSFVLPFFSLRTPGRPWRPPLCPKIFVPRPNRVFLWFGMCTVLNCPAVPPLRPPFFRFFPFVCPAK